MTPLPSLVFSSDSTTSLVTAHHEAMENLKFAGATRPDVPRELLTHLLLQQRSVLLPCTIDPGGTLGPIFTHLLWGRSHRPRTTLPLHTPADRTHTHLTYPDATTAASIPSTLRLGLFPLADSNWRKSHASQWFAHSFALRLPSLWATQVLAHNSLLASSLFLQKALSQQLCPPSQHRRLLHCAAPPPLPSFFARPPCHLLYSLRPLESLAGLSASAVAAPLC